jgi:aspartyl/asparaginyl beta-hydroxylase (cupin superfamily)/Tfp pilus assembly protein PilF
MNTKPADTLQSLVLQARDAGKAGRSAEAVQLWQRVLQLNPDHAEALLSLSIQALTNRDPQAALAMLTKGAKAAPRDPMIQLYLALANKELGQVDAESAAVTRALAIDPYFFPALLHQGMMLERLGKQRQAAKVFRNVLKIMPSPDKVAPGFQRAVEHAYSAVRENEDSLEKHLGDVLVGLRRQHAGVRLNRFERSLQVMIGRKKMYAPEPVMLHYADLPPIQFYDNELFPWIAQLEAATDRIRDELRAVLAESRAEFAPYIQYPPGAPVNQWKELNHSVRWSTYFLWRNGQRNDAHCERCPHTAEVLESLPLARIPNFSPTVMFSCLEPHTVIPPHTGETNTRLIAHLPLIVPPNCVFRVGNEVRPWEYGKAFVFDDSIEHEARNDSDELRVVLIFDIWNPNLDPAERELVAALVNGVLDYYRAED